ncbi:hypothetical protein O9992_23580 [Vibrio lentus]|nr:hypothetical protein [Vibrio lentus]
MRPKLLQAGYKDSFVMALINASDICSHTTEYWLDSLRHLANASVSRNYCSLPVRPWLSARELVLVIQLCLYSVKHSDTITLLKSQTPQNALKLIKKKRFFLLVSCFRIIGGIYSYCHANRSGFIRCVVCDHR